MPCEYLAHPANQFGVVDPLQAHLEEVGERAAQFAAAFGGAEEARIAGLLHDLGKFRKEFQAYLKGERKRGLDTHHAIYGGALAFSRDWPCSFAIAGHHAGLHDRQRLQVLVSDEGPYLVSQSLPILENRFVRTVGAIPESVALPEFLTNPWSLELYIRMIFSCLVDADRLAAEQHQTGQPRPSTGLSDLCDTFQQRIMLECASKPTQGTVNQLRREIFQQCVTKGNEQPGCYSLTVPTGGGKTLSGMAFALAHAKKWRLDRVIVVIPYLSIIEQNAAEYKRILDPENRGWVIEHHSAVVTREDNDPAECSLLDQAIENWDAPIVITTSVQFVESLFASSPSKCRKLHNIAKSVVIMDEVQTLPFHLLNPLLNVLRELKENYGASLLFMTATQPAFRRHSVWLSEGFGSSEVTEITADTSRIFSVLKRVNYNLAGMLDWDNLAHRMAESPQALAIVNVRRHAFELWEALRRVFQGKECDSLFHLSSSMCPEHRLFTLGEIKNPREGSIRDRLNQGFPVRVVATQLIEAGVDLDFPTVFRAMGPLDSIVQAAGRCNREGRMVDEANQPIRGHLLVFVPQEHALPKGLYKLATRQTELFLQGIPLDALQSDPDVFGRYFSQLLQLAETDHSGPRQSTIQEDRSELRFRQVASKAKVIADSGRPVVVPFGRGKDLIERIRRRLRSFDGSLFGWRELRALQRFMVNIRDHDFQRLHELGMITRILPEVDLFVLEEGCYNKELGLLISSRPVEDFIL
jgi:CRISPR-associated endonuclease/helicase Cas3